MFCPKCATQNVDGASFCRACGANISLVSQALTGQLAVADQPEDRYSFRRRRREPSLEEALRGIIMGVAFVVVSILVAKYAPAGSIWWFWLLIPAAGWLGRGIAGLARLKSAKVQMYSQPQLNTVRLPDLPSPKTAELMPPVPSVTEGTTRHLSAEPPTQGFASSGDQRPS